MENPGGRPLAIPAQTIKALKVSAECGAANNQFGSRLADRGVLYAADYVVDAGGMIKVAAEYLGWSAVRVAGRVRTTGTRLERVLTLAHDKGLSPNHAADLLACSMMARSLRVPADAA